MPLADLPLRETPLPPPIEIPRRSRPHGVLIWLVAAASLVIGIGIGFFTGYSAGERHARPAVEAQAFSEATVVEPAPAPVNPEPIVVHPEPVVEPSNASNVSNVSTASNVSNLSNGSIEVLSRPSGAQVILDGRVVGRTPLSIPDVSAGAHSVRLQLPTYNRWQTAIDVRGGARTRVAASLEQP